MIFRNPAGAPELACDGCGCRWFDRMTGCCYECGTPVAAEALAEYRQALDAFAATKRDSAATMASPCPAPSSSSPTR